MWSSWDCDGIGMTGVELRCAMHVCEVAVVLGASDSWQAWYTFPMFLSLSLWNRALAQQVCQRASELHTRTGCRAHLLVVGAGEVFCKEPKRQDVAAAWFSCIAAICVRGSMLPPPPVLLLLPSSFTTFDPYCLHICTTCSRACVGALALCICRLQTICGLKRNRVSIRRENTLKHPYTPHEALLQQDI